MNSLRVFVFLGSCVTLLQGSTPTSLPRTASPYMLQVNPLIQRDILHAKVVLRQAIRKQHILNVAAQCFGYGASATMLYMLVMSYIESNQLATQLQQERANLLEAQVGILTREVGRLQQHVQMPGAPITAALGQPVQQSAQGFSLLPSLATLRSFGSSVIRFPLTLGSHLVHSFPLLFASFAFNTVQQYVAQFAAAPDREWFVRHYTAFDEIYLSLLTKSAILDWESPLLREAKIGRLEDNPRYYSSLTAAELARYLKTIALESDHTVAAHEVTTIELNFLLHALQRQYAYCIAFCQLQQVDAVRKKLIQHHARTLMDSFNAWIPRLLQATSRGLLQEVMLGINKQQQVVRALMIATFPNETAHIVA